MSTLYFTGPCKWARLRTPDEKYAKYNISVGLDNKQLMEFQKLKTMNAAKIAEDGLFYVSFSRKSKEGKPQVLDVDGNNLTDLIGNGSKVTVKVSHRTWERDGATKGAVQLESVLVDELIKYDPDKKKEEINKPSTGGALGRTDAPPSTRPRIPF